MQIAIMMHATYVLRTRAEPGLRPAAAILGPAPADCTCSAALSLRWHRARADDIRVRGRAAGIGKFTGKLNSRVTGRPPGCGR